IGCLTGDCRVHIPDKGGERILVALRMAGRQSGVAAGGGRECIRTPWYNMVLAQSTDPKAVRQFLVEHVGGIQAVEGERQPVLSSERNLADHHRTSGPPV